MTNLPPSGSHNPASLRHGCVIMASGSATRFGSNKLLATLGGKPLVQHVIETTDGLFDKRVVVTRRPEVARLCRELGVNVVVHDEPARNDTVRLGMQALGDCDTVTFFQADQPLIGSASIAGLLQAAQSDPNSIWRARHGGMSGAPVLFPAWAFDELRHLPAGKGGGFVAKTHAERVRTVEVQDAWELFDVDTVNDLQALQQHLDALGK